jgi:hypothetical protein
MSANASIVCSASLRKPDFLAKIASEYFARPLIIALFPITSVLKVYRPSSRSSPIIKLTSVLMIFRPFSRLSRIYPTLTGKISNYRSLLKLPVNNFNTKQPPLINRKISNNRPPIQIPVNNFNIKQSPLINGKISNNRP